MSDRRPDTGLQQTEARPLEAVNELAQGAATEIGKGFSLFRLALKNIATYAWMNMKLCLTFACLAFLICLFTVYNAAINQRKDEFIRSAASSNYILSNSRNTIETVKKSWDKIAAEDTLIYHNFANVISSCYGVGGKYFADSSFFVLEVDGKQYAASKTVGFCTAAHETDAFFTPQDYAELRATYGLDSFFLTGDYPAEQDEVAIGLPMLEAYRLQPEDVMGKAVTVYLKDPRPGKAPLAKQYSAKVCGVIGEEFYKLSGHKNSNSRPYFLLRKDSAFLRSSVLYRYRVYFSQWPTMEDHEAWKQALLTDQTFLYAGSTAVDKVDVLNSIQILATNLYIIIGSALIVGLVLTVFLMIDKYIKVFARSGGILLSVGMRKSQLFGLLFLQLFLLCAAAVPLSFVFTIGGYFVINFLVKWLTAIVLTIAFKKLLKMLLIGVVVVIGIAFLFFAYALLRIRNRTVKDYLRVTVD